MINVMNSVSMPMSEVEKSLHPQLWHACAGGMAQVPPANSVVYYFPQGHAEHANGKVDFSGFPRIPPLILCRVDSIKYLADTESDEVYAKIRLVPLRRDECDVQDDENGFLGFVESEEKEKTNSFAKTLTQSDANNGGGFSVPRYCAETIFPRLDYSAEPPVQAIQAKDVHGEIWRFRHIYRGTPRRHLLTTGWSNFVNHKKLVAGDSVVFVRVENGDICLGIRRAKRGIGAGFEVSCGWNVGGANCAPSLYKGFPSFLDENGNPGNGWEGNGNCGELGLKEKGGNVRPESVLEAASLAASGQPFEVVYYPRAGTPEFVVSASTLRTGMRIQWCPGMRFKMAFETEDSSRISWFMGTVSSAQVDDPIHWPNSPWRLLEVAWDEPDLLHNVKRVSPWLVELVANIPHAIHLSPLCPSRKRPRLSQPSELPPPLPGFWSNPLSPSSPLCCLPDNINISSASVQGARHVHIGPTSPPDHPSKKLQPFDFTLLNYSSPLPNFDALSCSMRRENMGRELKRNSDPQKPMFLLFGQPILTAEQISLSCSTDTEGNSLSYNVSNGSGSACIQTLPPEASLEGDFPRLQHQKLSSVLNWELEASFYP